MGNFWMDLDKRMEEKAREEKRTEEVIAAYGTAVPRTSGYSYINVASTCPPAAGTYSYVMSSSGHYAASTSGTSFVSDEIKYVKYEPFALKATWSQEAVQDLKSLHNLDSEKEIVDLLAKQLNEELNG